MIWVLGGLLVISVALNAGMGGFMYGVWITSNSAPSVDEVFGDVPGAGREQDPDDDDVELDTAPRMGFRKPTKH
jgi:hypothetical protein